MHLRLSWFPAGHDRMLAIALGASIVLHAVLLSVHFKFPDALRSSPADTRLEVVLVNAKTHERPSKAELLAQANLDRGDSVDERRRAPSPLPVTLRSDGSVESVELDRSSGLKVLDAAAFKIVRMAGPYAAFPASIRRDTDLVIITRTWFFGQGDQLWTE